MRYKNQRRAPAIIYDEATEWAPMKGHIAKYWLADSRDYDIILNLMKRGTVRKRMFNGSKQDADHSNTWLPGCVERRLVAHACTLCIDVFADADSPGYVF